MFYRLVAMAIGFLCLAEPVLAVTRSWTGAASASWSDPGNWSPAGVPASADTLVFPAGVTRTEMTNDLPAGTSVGPMDFRTSYTLDGNPLTLTGNVTFDEYSHFTCDIGLDLGASVTLYPVLAEYNGPIDVKGHTLTMFPRGSTINGAISGTGSIVFNGPVSITTGGTFGGTLTATGPGMTHVMGSLPNASLTPSDMGGLSGTGTVGTVIIPSVPDLYFFSTIHPGPDCCGGNSIGTLDIGSLTINGHYHVDLVPAGTSDRLQVTGTVTLGGGDIYGSGRLQISVLDGALAAGQTFTIIDNDGTDPVSGTFSNLPEGAQLIVTGGVLAISYSGGDGNDVVLTTVTSFKAWTGASSELWSNPANWSPAGAPMPGESLYFPAGATRTTMTNDLPPGTSFGPMDFRAAYTLNGNTLTLTDDVTFDAYSSRFVWNAGLELGASVTLEPLVAQFNGPIDVKGHTLTMFPHGSSINGAISGTGSILFHGRVSISTGGTFSGTITATGSGTTHVMGSMPNASLTTSATGGLSGTGTLGAVILPSVPDLGFFSALRPGPGCCDGDGIGTIHTGSITIDGHYDVDLLPGGTLDQLQVNGTVTLGGGQLRISVLGSSPAAGQTFAIIDNDGSDPISGTFSGLPEGAQIAVTGGVLSISYSGGDGNDVVLTTITSIKTWTGANSALWSNPANWSPAGAPTAGESLLFPIGVARTVMTNDLPPGTSVGAMDFRASYTLNGNALTLTGDLTFDEHSRFVCNAGLELGASVTLNPVTVELNGPIDVKGHTLTMFPRESIITGSISGTGSLVFQGWELVITSSGSFSGTITATGATFVHVTGSMPDASLTAAEWGGLSGTGTLGAVTLPAATQPFLSAASLHPGVANSCCGRPENIGTLHTGSIRIEGIYSADVVPGGSSDQLQVAGTVTLHRATLSIHVSTGSPAAGETFTIIDNDENDPVKGRFANQPEGSIVATFSWKFRITYQGGDGNDVVLTVVEDTAIAPEQSAEETRFGETATFTAHVTALTGVPEGTVTFTDNGAVLHTMPLVNGLASLDVALDPGTHEVAALYDGTPVFMPSTAAVSHTVLRGKTSPVILEAPSEALVYGEPLAVSASVFLVLPASGSPSGSVTMLVDGSPVAEADLEKGVATFDPVLLDAGSHAITLGYAGDDRFEPGDSDALQVTVLKAPTTTEAVSMDSATGTTLTVNVTAPHRPALPVAGVVTISEDGVLLAQQSIAAGPAAIPLAPLTPGEHRLVVSYAGSGNFEASSTTVDLTVAPPQLFVRDVIVQEGDFGEKSVTLAVELSAIAADSVTVAYTLEDGTAEEGSDYRGAGGMLVFAPGEFLKTITLQLIGDVDSEENETLELRLSSPTNATLGQPIATITIADDDLAFRFRFGLVYATPPSGPLTLDLYTPSEGTGPFPLVLWIPGTTSYDAAAPVIPALGMTSHGYAVAVVRYRTPDVARFPAQLDDLRTAIRWLRANALQYNLATDRIAVWGASAGAHLASLLGTTNDAASPGAVSSDVQAVVAWGSPSDLPHLQSDAVATCNASYDDASSPQSQLLGCALNTCADPATAASPLSHVTPDDVPFLLMHGTNDCVVPAAQSTRFYEALRAAGVPATIELLDAGAPNTWTSPHALRDVQQFLDSQMARRPGKRRAVR